MRGAVMCSKKIVRCENYLNCYSCVIYIHISVKSEILGVCVSAYQGSVISVQSCNLPSEQSTFFFHFCQIIMKLDIGLCCGLTDTKSQSEFKSLGLSVYLLFCVVILHNVSNLLVPA